MVQLAGRPLKTSQLIEKQTHYGGYGDDGGWDPHLHLAGQCAIGLLRIPTIVTINVGGQLFTASLSTLKKYPESMLARMFGSDLCPSLRDSNGHFFIDRDGGIFSHIRGGIAWKYFSFVRLF